MSTRWKTAVIAGVAAATATVAMAAFVNRDDNPAAAQETTVPDTTAPGGDSDEEPTRTITVNGHGTVDVTPDIAHLDIGVQASAPKSQAALDRVSAESQTLVEALKDLGIAEQDIQTSGLSLWPEYDSNGEQITGYQGSVSVSVTARDIDGLGAVIDGVSELVGDGLTMGGIWFDYDDPEAVLEDARTAAIANARERAAQYAEAVGAEVGDVITISETVGGGSVSLFAEGRALAQEAAADMAIEPGSQELTVDVAVVFEMG